MQLAALGSDDGLDALRPAPAGLEGQPGRRGGTDMDDVDAGLLRGPRLVRRVEVQFLDTCHVCTSCRIADGFSLRPTFDGTRGVPGEGRELQTPECAVRYTSSGAVTFRPLAGRNSTVAD